MDDEAAAEQLRSEARAGYSAYHDDAIPLSLDGTTSPETSKKKAKRLRKLEKSARLGKSDRPKKSDRKFLAASQTSPSPAYVYTDSQAFVAESPSKSQALPPTFPSTKIDVPNSQVANGNSTSTLATSGHAVSPNDSKSKPAKRKRKRQAEEEAQDEVIPATPQEATDEGWSSQKRRKKHQSQTSVHSVYADAQEIAATPGLTQEISDQPASREEQNGAAPVPLIPKALLENLKAERSQRPQASQSGNKTHISSQRKQKAPKPSNVDLEEEQMADVQGELPDATDTDNAECASAASQSLTKKSKKLRKSRHVLEAPELNWEAPARTLEDGPPEHPAFDDIEATEPTESHRKEKKRRRRKKSLKSEDPSSSSRYSVGGFPKSPRKKRQSKQDPNKNYERARDEDDRTAADRALESSRDLGHPPELRTGGDYTPDEDELLRRAIRDFQQREALETADLVHIIQWIPTREDPTVESTSTQAETELKSQSTAFWDEIKNTGLLRKIKPLKDHIRATYHTFRRGPWSQDEDTQLSHLVELHPGNWKLIATHLHRLRTDVFNRWKDYVQHGSDRVTKRWSVAEEENFVKVLAGCMQRVEDERAETGQPPLEDYLANINWAQVCQELGGTRSRLQCQYKLRQMRERVPPPEFGIEIRPRGGAGEGEDGVGDEIEDGGEGGEDVDMGREREERSGKKKRAQKVPTVKAGRKQDFKSRELVSESDNAESEPEG